MRLRLAGWLTSERHVISREAGAANCSQLGRSTEALRKKCRHVRQRCMFFGFPSSVQANSMKNVAGSCGAADVHFDAARLGARRFYASASSA